MKKSIKSFSLLLLVSLVLSLIPCFAQSATSIFTDVPEHEWFAESVEYVKEKGLMNGITVTTFEPQTSITRGMIVTIIYRLEGSPEVKSKLAFSDVNPTYYYCTPIMWASGNGRIEIVKLLLDNNADINIKNTYGEKAIIWAAKKDNPEIIQLLIDNGADVNEMDEDKGNCAMWAAYNNLYDNMKVLIKNGADINAKNSDGNNSLMLAAECNSAEVLKLLLESGSDLYEKDNYGTTALMWAEMLDNKECVRILKEYIK